MSRSESSVLWVLTLLSPLVCLYGWTRIDARMFTIETQTVKAEKLCEHRAAFLQLSMRESADRAFLEIQKARVELQEADLKNLEYASSLRAELEGVSSQLFGLYRSVEQLQAGGSATAVEAREAGERLTKLLAEINRISSLLEPEDLVAKKKLYLDTQVKVHTGSGSGSGTLLSGNYVLSARHVVDGAHQLNVEHNGKMYPAKVIRSSEEYDLSLLRVITGEKLPYARLCKKAVVDLPLLSKVYVVGYPAGQGPYFTSGELCLKNVEMGNIKDMWMVSAQITFGNSGGGTFNPSTGELIGVPVAITAANGSPVYFMAHVVPGHRIVEWLERSNVKIE